MPLWSLLFLESTSFRENLLSSKTLLLKEWSADQMHHGTWKVVSNTESSSPPDPWLRSSIFTASPGDPQTCWGWRHTTLSHLHHQLPWHILHPCQGHSSQSSTDFDVAEESSELLRDKGMLLVHLYMLRAKHWAHCLSSHQQLPSTCEGPVTVRGGDDANGKEMAQPLFTGVRMIYIIKDKQRLLITVLPRELSVKCWNLEEQRNICWPWVCPRVHRDMTVCI